MSAAPRGTFRPRRWAWLLLLAALLAPAYYVFLPAGPFPPDERRTIVIERGQSLHVIARELQRVGIIRSPFAFLALARLTHLDRSIKAGQYAFQLGITVPQLLHALDRGMFGLDLITIPEGLTLREVAKLLGPRIGVLPSQIDSLARDESLLDSLGVRASSLEGWLAPDSYEWLPGTAPEVVLRTMVARTRERLAKATAGCDSLPFDFGPNELLTMASIVEAEAMMADERPHIARAYLNRLAKGMRLQADPTVGYALGKSPRSRLTLRDLRKVSPYNTYLHDGLPPGPIDSPGYASIEAVVNATAKSDDMYFVARGDGRHLFAATYDQHLANITVARTLQRALGTARKDTSGVPVDSATKVPAVVKAPVVKAPAAKRPARKLPVAKVPPTKH